MDLAEPYRVDDCIDFVRVEGADAFEIPQLSHSFTSWFAGRDRQIRSGEVTTDRIVWRARAGETRIFRLIPGR